MNTNLSWKQFQNHRGLSQFCAVRGAKWDCPPLRDGFETASWKIFHGFLLLSLLLAIGCEEGRTELPTAPVAGTVTYDGKPLGKGRVIFVHPSGRAAAADLTADGTFKLIAFQGNNQIAISCYTPEQMPNSPTYRPSVSPGKNSIPDRYASCGTSGLALEVKPGENTFKAELQP